ncbi:MAG TPA: hypothetical protein VFZ61_24125 [Polyangiales bacterium]
MPNPNKGGARGRAASAKARGRESERGPITAYPRAAADDLGSIPPPESGLSIDTEDLGAQFLSHATEQASDWPAADAARDGAGEDEWGGDGDGVLASSYDLDPDGWERALQRALRLGSLPVMAPRTRRARPSRDEEEDAQASNDDIDLTDESIHDASLLDHEGSELGEVESPFLRTDDTRTHCRRRGGHAPARRKRAG